MTRFSWIAASIVVFLGVAFLGLRSYTRSFSPEAVAEININALEIKVDYCQPKIKGRKIFGSKVPFNQMWLTAANEAAEIELKQDVYVGGKLLKAGKYALFAIPKEKEWTIIFNSVLDMWGHFTYFELLEVLRVEVPVRTTMETVEVFLITLHDSPVGVDMQLSWENTALSVLFCRNSECKMIDEICDKKGYIKTESINPQVINEFSETTMATVIIENGVNTLVVKKMPESVALTPEILDKNIKSAAVIFTYRVFIHTKLEKVDFVVHPSTIENPTDKIGTPTSEKSIKFTITREKALNTLKNLANLNTFEDLVYETGVENYNFRSITKKSEGKLGIDQVYAAMFN